MVSKKASRKRQLGKGIKKKVLKKASKKVSS